MAVIAIYFVIADKHPEDSVHHQQAAGLDPVFAAAAGSIGVTDDIFRLHFRRVAGDLGESNGHFQS